MTNSDSRRSAPQQKQMRSAVSGFTTLFAVLIASLLLSVGAAIYDVASKDLTFSIVTRESNFAIYAADTGVECALYWDSKYAGSANFSSGSVFATSTNSQPPAAGSGIFCNGADISTVWSYPSYTAPMQNPAASAATTTFSFSIPATVSSSYCVVVTVAKGIAGGSPYTTITSRGYNTCAVGSPNRIERAIQANY